jgi:hypothetical protein
MICQKFERGLFSDDEDPTGWIGPTESRPESSSTSGRTSSAPSVAGSKKTDVGSLKSVSSV